MSIELLSNVSPELSGLPYVDQYFGVWAMLEDRFNALRGHAQQVNVQLHLKKMQSTEARAAVAARGSTEVHVTGDGIAVVEIRGAMMKHSSSFSSNASTVSARRKIRAAAASSDVAGIMIVVDSPGGTVAGTQDLGDDIAAAAAKKPTFAYVEDLAASAGYWVASQASRIITNESALVGSIGVFNVVHDLSKMADEEGVKVHVVRFGDHKGTAVAGTEVTESQLAEYQKIVNAYGEDFVNAVAKGRGITPAVARQLADGRIHKGQAAIDLKLSDSMQSFDSAMEELVSETNQPRNRRNVAMSKESTETKAENDAATILTAVELNTSASIADLKQALPDASSDFLVEQLEANATLEQAQGAYVKHLAAENKQLRDDAKAKAEKSTEKPKASGNEPLDDVVAKDGDDTGSAAEAFDDKVVATMSSRKLSRPEAVAFVARKEPELRSAMVAEANLAAGRGV